MYPRDTVDGVLVGTAPIKLSASTGRNEPIRPIFNDAMHNISVVNFNLTLFATNSTIFERNLVCLLDIGRKKYDLL